MATQDIYFGETGQTLFYDCPEGRPSSVTGVSVFGYDVEDDGTAESATTGSASIGSPNAVTLSAAAGPGQSDPRNLPVVDASDVDVEDVYGHQRRYLVTENERKEWVEPVEVDGSANTVTLRYPLANDFTSSATVDSTRISIAIDSTWVADDDNLIALTGAPHYRVRWEYVVNSETYVKDSYFNLVRYAGDHEVTAEMVDSYSAGFIASIDINHQVDNAKKLIEQATREVDEDLRELKLDDAGSRDPQLMNPLIVRKVVVVWKRGQLNAGGGDPTGYQLALQDYSTHFQKHFSLGDSAKFGGIDGAAKERLPQNFLLK